MGSISSKLKLAICFAIRNNGFALYFASDEMRNNKEIVLSAVRNQGLALYFASDKMRNSTFCS